MLVSLQIISPRLLVSLIELRDNCRICTPRYDITLDQFIRVAHLLPRQRGNVAVDNYTFVNALLRMCRTGAPWRDLPECYGKWITVCQRFDHWSRNGAIERLTILQSPTKS